MTPERLREIEQLFHEARERPRAERDTFLARACPDDPALRREVESLLAQPPAGLIDAPVGALVAGLVPPASALHAGRHLGVFEVQGLLGTGGMGEVYRARDTRLGREVAIKILPRAFKDDPDRLARFEREARVLASLNHPGIGAIYGLEEADDVTALVIELVEGEDLAQRLAREAIPIAEVLPMARQIAEALEAAHEQGIIHRDLKPANIKVRPDGTVKVLDFGLAKALDPTGVPGRRVTTSPSISLATQAGVLLGTAAYMPPEQAKGRPVDRRADLWAFGCVLFEMLVGHRPFEGETTSDVLARIIERDPNWSALPAKTPASVRTLLRRCLEKDPRRRLDSAAVARLELEEASTASTTSGIPVSRRLWAASIAALVAGALVGSAVAWRVKTGSSAGETSQSPPVARFALALPSDELLATDSRNSGLALSPDGRYLAFVGGPRRQIFLRPIDRFDSKPLAGTDGADGPFFSPDGQWVGFAADRKLKKISVTGGAPFTICSIVTETFGASWEADGTIIFAPNAPGRVLPGAGLLRVSAEGGAVTVATGLRPKESEPRWPEALPGGKMVLYSASPAGGSWSSDATIYLQSLETGERRPLVKGIGAHYLPSGHLVYTRSGTVFAARFSLARQELVDSPVPVLNAVQWTDEEGPLLSTSQVGSMAYVSSLPPPNRTLVWVDRTGTEQLFKMPGRAYSMPRLSPDGRRLAVLINDERNDIWMFDLSRGTLSRLTSAWNHMSPVWTPDGRRLTFRSGPPGTFNIYSMPADGSRPEERLLASPHMNSPTSWSPDGRVLVYWDVDLTQEGAPDFRYHDISWVSVDQPDQPHAFLATKFLESGAVFSPDGQWLAYVSNESGRNEIYVRPFPGPGEKVQVSTDGGGEPLWPRNGHELLFRNGDAVVAADVRTGLTFSAGRPHTLFERTYEQGYWGVMPNYDVTADGQRFVMVKRAEDPSHSIPINVVVNWSEELKQRVLPK